MCNVLQCMVNKPRLPFDIFFVIGQLQILQIQISFCKLNDRLITPHYTSQMKIVGGGHALNYAVDSMDFLRHMSTDVIIY